jgi:hypothetical protein
VSSLRQPQIGHDETPVKADHRHAVVDRLPANEPRHHAPMALTALAVQAHLMRVFGMDRADAAPLPGDTRILGGKAGTGQLRQDAGSSAQRAMSGTSKIPHKNARRATAPLPFAARLRTSGCSDLVENHSPRFADRRQWL